MPCLADTAFSFQSHTARAGDTVDSTPSTHLVYGADRLTDDIVVSALDTLRMVRDRVGNDPADLHRQVWQNSQRLHNADDVEKFISRSWAAITRRLDRPREPSVRDDVTDLVAVLHRLRDLEAAVAAHRQTRASDLHRNTGEALLTLSRTSTVEELFQSIPAQATRLGFDRVLFSTVSSNTWHPQSVYGRDGSAWAASYLAERARAFCLPGAAAHRLAAQVDAPTMLERHERASGFELWLRSRSKTFWMIPVVDRQRVVALIHADCHLQERIPTRSEVEALQYYCKQLSLILAQRAQPPGRSFPMVDVGRRAVPTTPHLPSREPVRTTANRTIHMADTVVVDAGESLSQREIDVIKLMAEGLTNAQIGRRLTITEGTVKSHVKRILRKTTSANRAEAVANWMNAQHLTAV